MKEKPTLNRRQFLRTTGQAAATLAAASTSAPAILSTASAGKTIGVGCIGVGTRGGELLNAVVKATNVKVVAVHDVYGPQRQLHPKPRDSEVLGRRSVHRNRNLPHVTRIPTGTTPSALGCGPGRNRVRHTSV